MNKTTNYVITFVMLFIGCAIAASALQCFLIPNTILDGGITGISIIIYKLFQVPIWLLVLILNIPFIYIGYRSLGKNFLIRTVFSMLIFSLFLSFFEIVTPFTEEKLLATVFGGALLGIGTGIIIHFGGCTDGTESVAMVISKNVPTIQ